MAKLHQNIEANRQKDDRYEKRIKVEAASQLPDSWEAIGAEEADSKTDLEGVGGGLSRDAVLDEHLTEAFLKSINASGVNSERRAKLVDFLRELPSYKKRDEVIDLVHRHQVILVSGETGCGKTTQVFLQLIRILAESFLLQK